MSYRVLESNNYANQMVEYILEGGCISKHILSLEECRFVGDSLGMKNKLWRLLYVVLLTIYMADVVHQ